MEQEVTTKNPSLTKVNEIKILQKYKIYHQNLIGLKNGVSKDRYDDRRTGFDSRDLVDQNRYHAEDYGKIKIFLFINEINRCI